MTARMYDLRPHPMQSALLTSPARFRVVPAGRRSGKTERAKRFVIAQAAIAKPDSRFFVAAPTRDQAKAIYWNDLKAMIPSSLLATQPRETDLSLRLLNGAEIHVIGMDKPTKEK